MLLGWFQYTIGMGRWNRLGTVFLLLALVACQMPRQTPAPDRYANTDISEVDLASGVDATVELVFPRGYKLAPDAPHKVLAHPDIKYTRSGNRVTFTATRDGDNAFIDVYFCESETAAICAFHAVEVRFEDTADASASVDIPPP